jgi:hypothetical protein
MFVVMTIAVAAGLETMRRRSIAYGRRAAEAARSEREWAEMRPMYESRIARARLDAGEPGREGAVGVAEDRRESIAALESSMASCQRLAEYHGNLRRKYEGAASRPWLLVSPDPPEPRHPEVIFIDLEHLGSVWKDLR